jgi:hypothetical protein
MPYRSGSTAGDDWTMTEPRESGKEQTTAATERRAFESASPYDGMRIRSNSIFVWVGIVAGVVFIVAVIFFSGFFIGRSSYGNCRGGYHQPGMMGPSQSGPYGQMWPGMMGPYGPWPGQQSPTTTVPTTPRP